MRRLSMLLLCLFILHGGFILTANVYALDIKAPSFSHKPPIYPLDHGVRPDLTSFPVVLYLFATETTFFRIINKKTTLTQRYSKEIDFPIYLGYFIIDENFWLSFVNKSGLDIGITDVIDKLNSMPENEIVLVPPWYMYLPVYTVPRWSWTFVKYIIPITGIGTIECKIFISYGMKPDDDFTPEFSKTYRTTAEHVLSHSSLYLKNTSVILRNAPAGAKLHDISTLKIIPDPPEASAIPDPGQNATSP